MKNTKTFLITLVFALSACAALQEKINPSSAPFSVTVKNFGNVELVLSQKHSFSETSKSLVVRGDQFKPFMEYTYVDLPPDDELDDENTPYDYGAVANEWGEVSAFSYFKYTFYVKSTSYVTSQYVLSVNMSEKNNNERLISDTVRLMLFENDGLSDEHQRRVFAKETRQKHVDIDGQLTHREFISTLPQDGTTEDEIHLLAEPFVSDSIICQTRVADFRYNDIMRYTVVFWLEGEDPDSMYDSVAPNSSSLDFEITIQAGEKED